jgi:hypothetical protein
MDDKLKELLNGVLANDYLKNNIENALAEKIIETIKYDSSEFISECIGEIFNDEYKMVLKEELLKQRADFKKLILDSIKDQFVSIKSRFYLDISDWDLEKIFRDGVKIKRKGE